MCLLYLYFTLHTQRLLYFILKLRVYTLRLCIR